MTDLNWLNQGLDRLAWPPATVHTLTPDWSADPAVAELQRQFEALYGHHVQAAWVEARLAQALVPPPPPSLVAAPQPGAVRSADQWFGYASALSVALVLGVVGFHLWGGAAEQATPVAPHAYVPLVAQWEGPPLPGTPPTVPP